MFNHHKDCLENHFDENFLNNQTISFLVKLIQDHPDKVVDIFILLKINRGTSVFKVLDFPIKKKNYRKSSFN